MPLDHARAVEADESGGETKPDRFGVPSGGFGVARGTFKIFRTKRFRPKYYTVEDYLVEIVAELLGIGIDACDRGRSLIAMGATSLGIMRLKRKIETDLMVVLDADVVWRETGIIGLAVPLHQALLASPLWANAEAVERLAVEIGRMSDEEVSRELAVEPAA